MALSLDAKHLSSNRNYQPQLSNNFEIVIDGLGEEVTLAVSSGSLPEISNAVIEMHYFNGVAKVAGKTEYADGSIEIKDFITKDIEKKLNAWQKQVYNPDTGKMGYVDEYKRDASIIQYSPKGDMQRVWSLKGVWPTSISYGSLDYSSTEAKSITITLAYDLAVRE